MPFSTCLSSKTQTEKLQKFEDLYAIDISDLYFDVKLYLNNLGVDLLNQETKTAHIDFLKLIFDSVHSSASDTNDIGEDEEIIDLQN